MVNTAALRMPQALPGPKNDQPAVLSLAVEPAKVKRRHRANAVSDRRLCRPGDCADLVPASAAQQEIRTGDVGTILSEWRDATMRLGQIARSTPSCCPDRLVVGLG
jgi:hypothetical protein